MELNDSPEISSSTVWETGKAVIRGQIISYSTNKKKEDEKNGTRKPSGTEH